MGFHQHGSQKVGLSVSKVCPCPRAFTSMGFSLSQVSLGPIMFRLNERYGQGMRVLLPSQRWEFYFRDNNSFDFISLIGLVWKTLYLSVCHGFYYLHSWICLVSLYEMTILILPWVWLPAWLPWVLLPSWLSFWILFSRSGQGARQSPYLLSCRM